MKRTKKEFVDYNDYHDRPFGLKWGTAFALAELTQVITSAQRDALKQVVELPQMNRQEIDNVLQQAFLKTKSVSVQLNYRDENGMLLDSIQGQFSGMADDEHLYIEDHAIAWDMIRNIHIL